MQQWFGSIDGFTDVKMIEAYDPEQKREVRIQIVTERGLPDYFFIHAERQYPQDVGYVVAGNPIVTGLQIFGRTNRDRALSEYLYDDHEIWQATRRNSHPLSDLATNRASVGGVLIRRSDLGTLEHDLFRKSDLLDIDMVISVKNEAVSGLEINNWVKQGVREQYPIRVTVTSIYENGVMLRGGGTALSFVETREL